MCLLELEEKGHPSLFLCCFAHPSGNATGKWKGRRGKGKGKGESPETLSSACFSENGMRKEAEMEVWGRTSSPLMLLHILAL